MQNQLQVHDFTRQAQLIAKQQQRQNETARAVTIFSDKTILFYYLGRK